MKPNFPAIRRIATGLLAAAAGGACLAGCSADAKNTFSQMGNWISQDAQSFGSDITNAPKWMSGRVADQTSDLQGSVSFVTQELSRNAKATSENFTGAPAWFSNQTKENMNGLRDTTQQIGDMTATNAKRFYNDDILGAPDYVSNQTQSQMKDLRSGWAALWGIFEDTYNNFWKNIGMTFELMLIK